MDVPTFDSMMNPLLQALHQLGGSGTISEINEKTIEIMNLPDEVTDIPHSKNSYNSEVEYRLGWTKSYLKKYGLLENSSRGIWALVEIKDKPIKVDPKIVIKAFRKNFVKDKKTDENHLNIELEKELDDPDVWKKDLNSVLLSLKPIQFERLAQRILRESGFTHVEVTGKTGDGGIDGIGVLKLGGLISFHVVFQCKRYKGKVSPTHIRDFRGAIQGRADKGLFLTTGYFTRGAIEEAQRNGSKQIDLIDGSDLAIKLKELSLGINTELVEKVSVNEEWFKKV